MNRKKKYQNAQLASWKFLVVLLVAAAGLGGALLYLIAPRNRSHASKAEIPKYFISAEAAKPLPETLDPNQFRDPQVAAAYRAAREIPDALAQQPCFCHCDRHKGHRSLLDCFASSHASQCDICVKEAQFTMREHRKGETAQHIRAEIIQGAWKSIE